MERNERKSIVSSSAAKICIGFALLAIGAAIYLLFRSKTLYIYVWAKALGLSNFIDTLRLNVFGSYDM